MRVACPGVERLASRAAGVDAPISDVHRSEREEVERVHRERAVARGPVEVRARDAAGRADEADDLAARDGVADVRRARD